MLAFAVNKVIRRRSESRQSRPTRIRRAMVGLALLPVLMTGLAACGSPSSAGRSTLTVWYSTDDPVESQWSKGLVKLFELRHPKVNVQMRVFGLDDFNTKMQLALSAHRPPDVAYGTPRAPGIPVYVGAGELDNLSADAKTLKWSQSLRPGLLTQYNAPFTLYKTQKHQTSLAKVPIYGVPDAVAAVGLLYNKRLLRKLGLVLPKTQTQLVADARLAKHNGYIPFGLGNQDAWLGDDWYLTLVNSIYGPSYLNTELRLSPKFDFKLPGFYRASETLNKWQNAGFFTPQFASLDAQGGIDAFFQGKTLFQLMSSTEDAQVLKDQGVTHMPIGLTAFPGLSSGNHGVMPYSGYEGWVVPKATKNRSAAIQWISFMLGSVARHYLLQHGVLPATRVSPNDASSSFQREYLVALKRSRPGVYVDAAPVPNLNATMEANISIMLAYPKADPPSVLPRAMEKVYTSHGTSHNRVMDIDGEF